MPLFLLNPPLPQRLKHRTKHELKTFSNPANRPVANDALPEAEEKTSPRIVSHHRIVPPLDNRLFHCKRVDRKRANCQVRINNITF